VAAVSVGIVEGQVLLDLAYAEDKDAGVDANVVMRAPESFVEVQGTGEHGTFSRAELDQVLDQATKGIGRLFDIQRQALGW
jgi:ribonuclease PH